MKVLLQENPEHGDEFEVVDGELVWDPDKGPLVPDNFAPRVDEYKVYETVQGKIQLTDLEGNPLFGTGTAYPPRRGGLRWDPVKESYERDPFIKHYAWGRGGGKTASMFGYDTAQILNMSSEELADLKRKLEKYFD